MLGRQCAARAQLDRALYKARANLFIGTSGCVPGVFRSGSAVWPRPPRRTPQVSQGAFSAILPPVHSPRSEKNAAAGQPCSAKRSAPQPRTTPSACTSWMALQPPFKTGDARQSVQRRRRHCRAAPQRLGTHPRRQPDAAQAFCRIQGVLGSERAAFECASACRVALRVLVQVDDALLALPAVAECECPRPCASMPARSRLQALARPCVLASLRSSSCRSCLQSSSRSSVGVLASWLHCDQVSASSSTLLRVRVREFLCDHASCLTAIMPASACRSSMRVLARSSARVLGRLFSAGFGSAGRR